MRNRRPPQWIDRLLEELIKDRFHDEVIGDMHEWFEMKLKAGVRLLSFRYLIAALNEIKRYQLRSTGQLMIRMGDMTLVNNNLKIGIRSLIHRKMTTFLNVTGLSSAFVCLIFILVFVGHEFSVDRYHEKSDNIYKVLKVYKHQKNRKNSNTQTPLGTMLEAEFGHMLEVARYGNDPLVVNIDNQMFYEGEFYWGDASLLTLFDFPLKYGSKTDALKEPNTVVLTNSVSEKYFGVGVNPVGELLPVKVYDGDQELVLRIDAVIHDLPSNTDFPFELIGSIENAFNLYQQFETSWGFNWLRTYVYVPDSDDMPTIEESLPDILESRLPEGFKGSLGYAFQPLNDVHLYSGEVSGYEAGNIEYVLTFCLIAFFILTIAIINKVNLTTAGISRRSLEVGIRKANGASRGAVFRQYFTEYVLLFTLSCVLSLVLALLLWTPFTSFVQLDIHPEFLFDSGMLWIFLGLLVGTALVGGTYPALLLSRIGSVEALTSRVTRHKGKKFRKVLVVVQFSISVFLIICTAMIFQQVQFMKNQDLGFEPDNLIRIKAEDKGMQERLDVLKSEILRFPAVQSVAISGESLPSEMNNGWGIHWDAVSKEQKLGLNVVSIDSTFLETIGAELILGENLSLAYRVDSARSLLINEKAMEMIGREGIIGKRVELGGKTRKIIGVIRDYHYRSLKEPILPVAYFVGTSGYRSSPDNIFVRVDPQKQTETLSSIADLWNDFSTAEPLDFQFVQQSYNEKYVAEARYFQLFVVFAAMSIIISCIGLFGMVVFITNDRTKEISIRKVLGSSVGEIVRMIGLEFTLLVIIGFIVAIPFALYSIRSWLDQFPYRVDISIDAILIAGILALVIAWLTIGFNTIKVATSNPVRYLRQE